MCTYITRFLQLNLIAILFMSGLLFAQNLDSPPYGISIEKWEQMHTKAEIHNKTIVRQSSITGSFNNGGFESGNLSGWITNDFDFGFFPLQAGPAGINVWEPFFTSEPTEGTYAVLHGWDGPGPDTIQLAQDITLTSTAISLEFDYRAAWDLQSFGATLDRQFMVKVEPSGGGSPLQIDTVLTAVVGTINNDTGAKHISIDLSAYANSSIRISFDWTVPESNSGPAFFQLDDVYIKNTGPQINVVSSVDFGLFEVGSFVPSKTITIRSVGTEDLNITTISDPGLPFSLSNLPSLPVVIAPGGSETFEVSFSTLNPGDFNTSMIITSNDPNDPSFEISLTGEAIIVNPALSDVVYASTGNQDGGRLLTIDINTGAGTLIGTTGMGQVPGLAINSNGFIYGISDNPDADFYKIDAVTGSAVFVGSTELGFMPAIAFDGNDVLYGIGLDFNTGLFSLYTIDTNTGVPTIIGTSDGGNWRGMAFDPTDGTIWASTAYEEIYIINPETGESSLIGTTGLELGVPDIFFDANGNLYGAIGGGGGGSNSLISIDKTNGAGTIIGPIGFSSVSGLAIRQQPISGSQIGIFPRSRTFSNTEIGTSSSPLTVTIRSIGSENLSVTNISDPELPFVLTNLPSFPIVIQPGESVTLEVVFSPTNPGDFNSTIVVTSDDPDNPRKEVALSGNGVAVNPALPGVCYASTGFNDGGRLLTIDINTGVGTLVGPTGIGAVPGLAINKSGIIYATGEPDFSLYKIDALTGSSVFAASTNLFWIPAIAFNGDDILYGLGTDYTTNGFALYTINTSNGELTLVGETGIYDLRGMAFNPADGTLWASTSTSEIYIIDSGSATPTLIGTTGFSAGVPDIFFDAIGNLYGSVGGGAGTNNLISINKTTGAGTVIGPIGFVSVSGLALTGSPVSVDDNTTTLPLVYDLSQNYPNPFNPTTSIKFQIPTKSYVTLKVFGVLGNEVKTLLNEEKEAGNYNVKLNAEDLSSGVYFYRLEAGDFVQTRKMILLK